MIINVRGTHGSGKSHLVRAILRSYRRVNPIYMGGRRQPIGYECRQRGCPRLFVLGHYETPGGGGGCDTIGKPDIMFQYIKRYAKHGWHVLYEGIVAQHGVPRAIELHDLGYDLRVFVLDLPLAKCIRAVKRRRKARGNDKPFDPKNLIEEWEARILPALPRLRAAGIRVTLCASRRRAAHRIRALLGAP